MGDLRIRTKPDLVDKSDREPLIQKMPKEPRSAKFTQVANATRTILTPPRYSTPYGFRKSSTIADLPAAAEAPVIADRRRSSTTRKSSGNSELIKKAWKDGVDGVRKMRRTFTGSSESAGKR